MFAILRRGLALFFLVLISTIPLTYGWDYARDIAGLAFYALTVPFGVYAMLAE